MNPRIQSRWEVQDCKVAPSVMEFSFIVCAQKVLEEFGEGKPMHYREITRKALEQGWLVTAGKTPESTMGAVVGSKIRNQKKRGEQPLFVQHTGGYIGLSQWMKAGLTPQDEPQDPKSLGSSGLKVAPSVTGFSFIVCAQKVLEEFGEGKPMYYRDITTKAQEQGWLVTAGKTPASTMGAQVGSKIRNQKKRGEQPFFVQNAKGYIGLSQWMKAGLASQIEQHNHKTRKSLHKKLSTMNPDEFETLISLLLTEMGFEKVEVTKLSGDKGIDVRGTLVVGDVIHIKMAIQAKKWKPKNNVQAPVVQQVRGSLGAHEQGLIITTSDFSSGADKEASQADKTPIALMNGEQLVTLLMEHGFGVRRSTPDVFEIDEESLVMGRSKQ